jgi:SAM-dependent methyltransferase
MEKAGSTLLFKNTKDMLKQYYKKQLFRPSVLGIFTNPFFITRSKLFREIKKVSSFIGGRVLDVGCGQKPYQSLFPATEYVGMDVEISGHNHADEQIDVYYDGILFPFEDHSFDSIICNQVLEHVATPCVTLSEIHRVLKPQGYVLLTVPFLADEHEQPFDFYRYTSFGMKYLLEDNEFFEIVKTVKCNRNIALVSAHFWNTYWYKLLQTPYPIVSLLITPIIHAPITILSYIGSLIFPRTNDFYTDYLVLAHKK